MKKMLAAVLVLAFLICCSFAYAEEAEYKELKKGSKGEDVRLLQERLIELGYLTGKADGSYGNQTKEAVELFQASENYSVITGVADEETQSDIFYSGADSFNEERDTLYEIDYEAMIRNPDDINFTYTREGKGYVKTYKFKGKVIQIVSDSAETKGDRVAARVATKGSNKDIVYVEIDKDCVSERRIREGDTITFYGIFYGEESFSTVLGAYTSLLSFGVGSVAF